MKKCLKCGQSLLDDSNFCMYCGSDQVKRIVICPKCKKELPEESKYCLYCGASVYGSTPNAGETTHVKAKGNKIVLAIVSIVIIVLVAIEIGFSYMNSCNRNNASYFFNVSTISGEYHVSPGETFTINCSNSTEATLTSLGSNFFTYSNLDNYKKNGKAIKRAEITPSKGTIIGVVKIKNTKTNECLYVFVY